MPEQAAARPTIVFPMGGKGERMGAVDVPNKALIELPGANKTLLEYSRDLWDVGFERLVLLMPPTDDESYGQVRDAVSSLSLRCEVRYSPDPYQKCGRTRALAGAIENGCIPRDRFFIVHNPDDVVINYPGSFAADLVRRHQENASGGCLATVVTTDSTVHTFTGFQVSGDRVTGIEHNPVCDKKAHIGITVFEPALADDILAAARDESSSDFEKDMFARLAAESRLGYFLVPLACWVAVNTPKDLSLFEKRFKASA